MLHPRCQAATGQTRLIQCPGCSASSGADTRPVTSRVSSRFAVLSTQLANVFTLSSVRAPVSGRYQVSSASEPARRARSARARTIGLSGTASS